MDFKNIDFGKKHLLKEIKELSEYQQSELASGTIDPDEAVNWELAKKHLSKLHYLVAFGRGYWAGADGEIVLVYNPEKDSFHWISVIWEKEELTIRNLQENDPIFDYLKNFDEDTQQFNFIDDYFEEEYPKLPYGGLDDIGIDFIEFIKFKDDVWWHLASCFYDTRKEFEDEVENFKFTVEKMQRDQAFLVISDEVYTNDECGLIVDCICLTKESAEERVEELKKKGFWKAYYDNYHLIK